MPSHPHQEGESFTTVSSSGFILFLIDHSLYSSGHQVPLDCHRWNRQHDRDRKEVLPQLLVEVASELDLVLGVQVGPSVSNDGLDRSSVFVDFDVYACDGCDALLLKISLQSTLETQRGERSYSLSC